MTRGPSLLPHHTPVPLGLPVFSRGWAPGDTESPRSLSASSPHQAQLRTLLALAAFSTATAAVVIGACNFYEYHFESEDICDISPSGSWPTSVPHTPSPEEVRRLHLCLSYLNMLKVGVQGGGSRRWAGRFQTVDKRKAVHQKECHLFCPKLDCCHHRCGIEQNRLEGNTNIETTGNEAILQVCEVLQRC